MVQTVRIRTLKAEVWVQFEDIPSNICGGHNAEL